MTLARVLPGLLLSVILAGCSTDATDDAAPASDESNVTAGRVESFFVPISELETSTTRTAKVATMKIRNQAEAEAVKRCHQYRIADRDMIVCRDAKTEIVMDAEYGTDFTRWARVRFANGGAPEWFTCKQVSERPLFQDAYGSTTGHECKPKAADADARKLGDAVDAEPVLNEHPTNYVYLPTNWAKTPAESWSTWAEELAKAAPAGEYIGYGRSSSKPCKVKVTSSAGKTEVAVISLDANGAETRVNARIELTEDSVYGGFRKDDVKQAVASASRPASVMIVSGETETTTNEYYTRNLRVVRYPDQPASADAGHSAIFINENYCQRLSPAIPAW
jgi:hypothetical protein